MEWNEWSNLKHGDKIRFVGEWNPRHIGDVETIYVANDGRQYIASGESLFPLTEFAPYDWEKVEVEHERSEK